MKRSAFDLLLKGSKAQRRIQEADKRGSCPICGSTMAIKWISDHIDKCLDSKTPQYETKAPRLRDQAPADHETPYQITQLPVKGLYIIHDFISVEEESELIKFLDSSDNQRECPVWKASRFNGQCLSKGWGVKTEHGTYINKKVGFVRKNEPDKGELDLPPQFDSLLERVHKLHRSFESELGLRASIVGDLKNLRINEGNANSYEKGEGHHLRPHVDDRFLSGPVLINLSLAGRAKMRYQLEEEVVEARRCEVGTVYQGITSHHSEAVRSIDVELPRRALQIVSGPARFNYEHSIPNALLGEHRRVSITFRQAGDRRKGVLGQPPTAATIESFFKETSL
jgi:hypothetical protein